MKKRILLLVIICAFALSIGSNWNTAMSQGGPIDPECPNGCIYQDMTGCYCYDWYPYLTEYDHGDGGDG
ncbi:MAG: hypothetical protein R6U04_02910 [Bacteroidales bacterium]